MAAAVRLARDRRHVELVVGRTKRDAMQRTARPRRLADQGEDAVRPWLAFYLGAMGSREKNFYVELADRAGHGGRPDAVGEAGIPAAHLHREPAFAFDATDIVGLASFYAELTGLVQPLSGEYAGYRNVFSELPFSTGYGVDIGLLIDITERYGVDRIAQVDLGRRIHRNRPTLQLGQMSFQVMQAMFERLDDIGRVKLARDLPEELTQFGPSESGPQQQTYALEVIERPPYASLNARITVTPSLGSFILLK